MPVAQSTKNPTGKTQEQEKPSTDLYDQWRPPTGIKYSLSETHINMDNKVPRLDLKYTTVEYAPGQDLAQLSSGGKSIKSDRYPASKHRGPVWKFIEEIEENKMVQYQNMIRKLFFVKKYRRNKQYARFVRKEHAKIIHKIGPFWYHELSRKQMESADMLKVALERDYKLNTTSNTIDSLSDMGIVYGPTHDILEYSIRNYYLCPTEFLLALVRLCQKRRLKINGLDKGYNLNDRIMLSAVVHLSMRVILRELHLRLPSPPRDGTSDTTPKTRKQTYKIDKTLSPYLQTIIPIVQVYRHGLYKNRHKEYASLEYFDYIDDMYDVLEEEIPAEEIKVKKIYKPSKYNRPPKIPVKQIESKKQKRIIYVLKKPEPYTSPCKDIPKTPFRKPQKSDEAEKPTTKDKGTSASKTDSLKVNVDAEEHNVCQCKDYNEQTEFDLNIKITSREKQIRMSLKLKPYNAQNPVGELQLVEEKTKNSDLGSDGDQPVRKIEYSCVCCYCKKNVNILAPGKFNYPNTAIEQTPNRLEAGGEVIIEDIIEEKVDKEDKTDNVERTDKDDKTDKVCKCSSEMDNKDEKEPDIWSNLDDSYYACTCKSSDSCTCCICGSVDPQFLLKIKRYNEFYNTNYGPCLCHCKCKQKRKNPRCEEPKIKYCFCQWRRKRDEARKAAFAEAEAEATKTKKPSVLEKQPTEEKLKSDSKDKKVELQEPVGKSCQCEKIYQRFMDAHESCMSLFGHYKRKIEIDVQEYLTDLQKNRCTCGDSLSTMEDEQEKESTDSCLCLKESNSSDSLTCKCHAGKSDDLGCTCASTSSSSNDNGHDSDVCPRPLNVCSCPAVYKIPIFGEDLAEDERYPEDKNGTDLKKDDKKDKEPPDESIDSRIFVFDKFPKKKSEQRLLLKKAMQALADDGYPLAKLPGVCRLPHFNVWLAKRSRSYVSMEDRAALYYKSKLQWNHLLECKRDIRRPQVNVTDEDFTTGTWHCVERFTKIIQEFKLKYSRTLKQGHISLAQELFPTTFHYLLPTKTFRECFFAYTPPDENHVFDIKPWGSKEYNDMLKHTCAT